MLLGFAYGFVLYFKNKREEFPKPINVLLFIFRFITVSMMAFFLLEPMLKTIKRNIERPIIIIAQDNSESIIIGKDSAYYKSEYTQQFKNLITSLKKDFEVQEFSFGDTISKELTYSFSDKQTDFSTYFEEIYNLYSNRNVGALILASDGIINQGINPLYAAEKFRFPVYTIALGDTNIHKDAFIKKINYNRTAYLGNKFPLEVVVNANKFNGQQLKLTIFKESKILGTRLINITGELYSETFSFQLEATEKGMQKYLISISRLGEEITYSNNQQIIFVDVLDGRQKVLILAANPHPDVSAIKQAIESNINYEVETAFDEDFTKSPDAYNLIITHQIPDNNPRSLSLASQLMAAQTPLLLIIGNQTNINSFNGLKTGVNILVKNSIPNDVYPSQNNNFNLFTLQEETYKAVSYFTPLQVPFGQYSTSIDAVALFNQKVGNIPTNQPLFVFSNSANKKIGVICGEGMWRWRLASFFKTEKHDAFNEIFNKTVQYLSLKVNKELFRIIGEHTFLENQDVELDAELYNESYELINEPEIEITVQNQESKKFTFVFSKRGNAYHLNAGKFPVGDYKYLAQTKVGGKSHSSKGAFTVLPLNIESVNTLANHRLLYNLAEKNTGKMVYPQKMNDLVNFIKQREDVKPVSFMQKRFFDLINLKWFFFIFLSFLTAEWLIRKRLGSY